MPSRKRRMIILLKIGNGDIHKSSADFDISSPPFVKDKLVLTEQ